MKTLPVETFEIAPANGLDAIQVFWVNVGFSQGHVVLTCWGSAWTAYFGGMSGQTIQEFFASADTPYLVTKLGITPHLKQGKRERVYLGRIIDAVKAWLEANRYTLSAAAKEGGE